MWKQYSLPHYHRPNRWISAQGEMITVRQVLMFGLLFVLAMGNVTRANAEPRHGFQSGANGTARIVAWSPDSKTLAVGGNRGIWLYNPMLEEKLYLGGHQGEITALAWHPRARQIAATTRNRAVQIWDITTGKAQTLVRPQRVGQATEPPFTDLIGSISFSPDGSRLASAIPDVTNLWENAQQDTMRPGSIEIWNTATGKLASTFKTDGPVVSVLWHPDGKRLLVTGLKTSDTSKIKAVGFVKLVNPQSGDVLAEIGPSPDNICGSPEIGGEAWPVNFPQWTDKGGAVAMLSGGICIWVPASGGTSMGSWPGQPAMFAISFDGKALAVGDCGSGDPSGNTPATCQVTIEKRPLVGQARLIARFLTWSPDARFLAVLGCGTVSVIDSTVKQRNSGDEIKPVATIDPFVKQAEKWEPNGTHCQ